eukprot:10147804-Ditylum_brightwellii.AAC.1
MAEWSVSSEGGGRFRILKRSSEFFTDAGLKFAFDLLLMEKMTIDKRGATFLASEISVSTTQ